MSMMAIKKPDFLAGEGILPCAARFRADFLAAIDDNRDFTLIQINRFGVHAVFTDKKKALTKES